MKESRIVGRLVCLAIAAGLAVVAPPVPADPAGECRQEAELYAVPPEQLNDYVQGCIESRGGDYYPDPADQGEAVAPAAEAGPATVDDGAAMAPDSSGAEGNVDGAQ